MREEEKRKHKNTIHARIWTSGLIATVIFTVIMIIFEEERTFALAAVYFVVFYLIWVIVHYIFLRKHFKHIDQMDNPDE